MLTTFLICRRCQLLHPLPAARDARFGDDEARHELSAFRSAHAAHALEEAERVPEDTLFDRPTWDPMATRWFHVAAGTELLLVRSWRPSLAEPRRYELEQGAVAAEAPWVDVDEPLLRRALDRHFYPHAVRATKLDAFVGAVRELLEGLDAAQVETCFDDVTLANTAIGPFPVELCDPLLSRCAAAFDAWELDRLRLFVGQHRGEDGALAVRVRRSLVSHAA